MFYLELELDWVELSWVGTFVVGAELANSYNVGGRLYVRDTQLQATHFIVLEEMCLELALECG